MSCVGALGRGRSELHEKVFAFFAADGGVGAVAANDLGVFGERQELVVDGADDLASVAAGEIGAADGIAEEGVAGDQDFLSGDEEAEAALGVAGRVEDLDLGLA